MIDFANTKWNPLNKTPVVLHEINSKTALENLPSGSYITLSTGAEAAIITDMHCMALVNMIKPKFYVTSESNEDLFKFCRQIGTEPTLVLKSVEPEPEPLASPKDYWANLPQKYTKGTR